MNPPNSENENDPLRNYFRAIDYLENNIDFPPDQTDNLIERYMYHKKIFAIVLIFLFGVNFIWTSAGILQRDNIVSNILAINNYK